MTKPGTVGYLIVRLQGFDADLPVRFHAGAYTDLVLLSIYTEPRNPTPAAVEIDVGMP